VIKTEFIYTVFETVETRIYGFKFSVDFDYTHINIYIIIDHLAYNIREKKPILKWLHKACSMC